MRFTETLRRVYHDLIVRRSMVKVVQAKSFDDLSDPPVFIIGVYRSGTTLLRYILDSHSQFCCPPESDFILPLTELLEGQREPASLEAMGFDEAHVVQKLREVISYFFMNYAQSVQKKRWVDKTPSYVNCLGSLKKIFPEARFLMLYRHGLDQAHSMTRGGSFKRSVIDDDCQPNEDLRIGACRYWARQVNTMLEFEAAHPEACFRILYEELCGDSQPVLEKAFEFLEEPFEPQVLNYGDYQHTVGKEDGRALSAKKIQSASSHFAEWDPSLRQSCLEICNPALNALGYNSRG